MKFKQIAAFCFALSFLMALVVFGGIGRGLLPVGVDRFIFIGAGLLGLFFNLISYRADQPRRDHNLVFWLGTIILFCGLIIKIQHWPYGIFFIGAGALICLVSFFYAPKIQEEKEEELLDSEFEVKDPLD